MREQGKWKEKTLEMTNETQGSPFYRWLTPHEVHHENSSLDWAFWTPQEREGAPNQQPRGPKINHMSMIKGRTRRRI